MILFILLPRLTLASVLRLIGLNDQEWAVVEPLIPYRWGISQSGTQPLHPRKILNTLIWILTTGARWCDVPIGEQWASRACAHKYLGLWKEAGILERVLVALQEVCIECKMIDLTRLAIDDFFSSEKGGGEKVDHGYKEKGVTTHLVEKQVVVELKSCEHLTGEHQAQLINYLAVTNLSVGLLTNFWKRKLEYRKVHHPAHHAACDLAYPVPF